MRVLYYLEPYQELNNPLFRFATARNHLEREIRGLLDNAIRDVHVALLCSEPVAAAIRAHKFLPDVRTFTVSQAQLARVYPDYVVASARWYNRDFSPEAMERMVDLCAAKLGDFEPDVIVCYESNAPFLEALFPDALLLHDTLGMLSRAPYPETSALDPFGIGKDAFPVRYAEQLRHAPLSSAARSQLAALKDAYRCLQLVHSPVLPRDVRGRFERVVLLPLQVSRYFMFDENCPPELRGASQLDFLRHVLERVEPEIGVYVTMHGREAALFPPKVLGRLEREFPNFIFSERVQGVRWPSQHVLPHVDGVVTVSSSVGLQAPIWDLPVIVLGRSHVAGVASGSSLAELPALLERGRTDRLDAALYHLLTRYYPSMDRYHHRGDWLVRFLERGIARKRGGLDFEFFAPIDDPELVMSALVHDTRPEQYQSELRSSAPAARVRAEHDVSQEIAAADLVSFDVFDTLVTRPLSHPRAVFELLAPRATALLAEHGVGAQQLTSFRQLREQAALQARAAARGKGVEEYDLRAVYEALCAAVGAPVALAAALKQLEEQVELAIHMPRERGRRLFEQAVGRGKRVVLLSDIFLDAAVVAEILSRCGYRGYDRLYVSSELGLLKRTGRLYERVKALEGQPRRWLHFGDNYLVDVQTAARHGISARHVPNISDLYAAAPTIVRTWGKLDQEQSLGAALQHGVISRKFHDRSGTPAKSSRFEGSAYRLGYEAGGPILLAFAQWVAERSARDGITDVYFLARDGHLPKQIYELIASGSAETPRVHYLYASRRAYSVASLSSVHDILTSFDRRFGGTRVADVLRDRFGLDPAQVPPAALERAGFASIESAVDLGEPVQRARLEHLLTSCAELILRQAAEERADLLAYLQEQGLLDPSRRIALVDIGHHASLQVALTKLTGRSDFKGYYFATFYPAQRAYRDGFEIASYLLEFEDPKASEHVYCQNVGLFEFLFLPALPSLVRIRRDAAGELEPVFVAGDEAKRFGVVDELHRGVLDFTRDVIRASFGQPWRFQISKNDAIREFAQFAARPDRRDAALLDGVAFVDRFGGFPVRYLIAPRSKSLNAITAEAYERESWWRNGAWAVSGLASRFERSAARDRNRKLRKLLRDPRRFVSDMKLTRSVRRLLARLPSRGE